MNFEELINKTISLVIWNAEKEEDVRVFLGELKLHNNEYFFSNEEKGWCVRLDEDLLNRIKTVPNDLKEMLLDAEYTLTLTMGNLQEMNDADIQSTGLRWEE